jgi:hypothetical protein
MSPATLFFFVPARQSTLMDTIEVEVDSLVAVPLRHQLVRMAMTELQSMAYNRELGGPIARATKHELAARLASDILARRVRDEDSTVGSGNDDEAAPQCGLHREERQWEDGGDEGGPAAR